MEEPVSFATRWRTMKQAMAKFFARNTPASTPNIPLSKQSASDPSLRRTASQVLSEPGTPFEGSGRFKGEGDR